MNLIQFLKKVDITVSDMTKEQLQSCIHELARTLSESERYHFLDVIGMVQGKNIASILKEKSYCDEMNSEIKAIKEILAHINDGKRCLDSEYNEEWDDWYNSDVDEVLFSDPEHLLKDIEKGIRLLHKCVDMELYKEGLELAELLSVLEVYATGDYNAYDGTPLGVHELYVHDLLSGTFETVLEDALYLAYMGNEQAVRAEEVYYMMSNFGDYHVTLERMMQKGSRELPDFQEFLMSWIEFLGCQTGPGVKLLLQEAQSMVEDEGQMLEIARKYVKQQPELYKHLLQNGVTGAEWDKMLAIGLEALQKIPVTYTLRSEIALLTAEFANRLQDKKNAEFCWLEAFRSHTSVVNYMRLRYMVEDWKTYRSQVAGIYKELYKKTNVQSKDNTMYYYQNVPQSNYLDRNTYCMLLFFDGDYENVIRSGLSETEALGWSSTFMKEGLALFLLLLYKREKLSKGLESMLSIVSSRCGFQVETFLQGTGLHKDIKEKAFFWELLSKWKRECVFTEEDATRWLKMIEQYIAKRTEAIMNANRRNYYGECAAFIAAYGEVCEARDGYGTKECIMERYKTKYPRRRAFHQELREYGMYV